LVLLLLVLPVGLYLATRPDPNNPLVRATGQAGSVNLYFSPAQIEVAPGETFPVAVKLESERETLTGGQITVSYPPEYLSLSGEPVKGGFFNQLVTNVNEGQVTLTVDGEVVGQGTVATLNFQAGTSGEVELVIAPGSVVWGSAGEGNLLGITNNARVIIRSVSD
jgi:hypothetical protein